MYKCIFKEIFIIYPDLIVIADYRSEYLSLFV